MQQSTRPTAAATAWTLTDGHAGNVRQVHALATALGMTARDWTLEARAPWRWLAPRRLPGAGRGFDVALGHALVRPPSLAIGCGRQAALATRLAREHGARAVQILDPRIDPRHWDLVIVPEHDRLRGSNVVTLLGSLHPVDDAWLAHARAVFSTLGALPGPRTAVLVGGTSAHARIDTALLDSILAPLLARVTAEGGSVLATASRRTPVPVRDALAARLDAVPHRAWTSPADGLNPYPGLLAWADRIVCTADSVNMLSEACATTAPVFVAGLDGMRGRPRAFVDRLLELGRVRRLDAALEHFDVTPVRETARVAAEVRTRLGL